MIAFEPTEDQRLMQESVAQFARATLGPRVRLFESMRGVPPDVRKVAGELGLALATVPESCGGQGLGMLTGVLLEEELGAVDAAAAFALGGPGAFGTAVVALGTEEQARELLADFAGPEAHDRFGAVAWSEPRPCRERAGFSTKATPRDGGWVLTGQKAFVANAEHADRFVVFAQVDEAAGWGGIGAFVVRREAPGVTVGARHDTLGLDAASFADLSLAEVAVEGSARLAGGADFTVATLRFFAKHALVIGARALGVARLAFETAREHCDNRKAFGKPIGHFQAVAFNLADRHMDVESARWLLWRAAWAWDAGLPEKEAIRASAEAVATALEVAMRTSDDSVGLHGGSGFVRDLIVEKLMRDAKQLALCCPTAEQLDQIATAFDLAKGLDPALVLPTPDTQAIFT